MCVFQLCRRWPARELAAESLQHLTLLRLQDCVALAQLPVLTAHEGGLAREVLLARVQVGCHRRVHPAGRGGCHRLSPCHGRGRALPLKQ